MPTPDQINAAKTALTPQPYDAAASKLTGDAQATLLVFLRKYLADKKRSGGYTQLQSRLAAAVGINAAMLQAVLTNVGGAGSKVAKLTGEVEYSTQDTVDNELEFALLVMYEPVPYVALGTQESDMAMRIRGAFSRCRCGGRGCRLCFDELRMTVSNF